MNSSVELVAPQPRTVRKPLDMQENQLVISFNTVLTQMELYFVTSRPPASCAPCTHLNRASLTRPTPPILSPPGSHQPFIAASLESPLSPPVTMSNPAPSVMPEDSPQSLIIDPAPSVVPGDGQQPKCPTSPSFSASPTSSHLSIRSQPPDISASPLHPVTGGKTHQYSAFSLWSTTKESCKPFTSNKSHKLSAFYLHPTNCRESHRHFTSSKSYNNSALYSTTRFKLYICTHT